LLGLIGHVGTLGQDRTLEPAHALDRDAGRVRDFLDRFPARIRAWISLGRNGLSTSISYCASLEVWPRATALSRSSIGNVKRALRPGTPRTAY